MSADTDAMRAAFEAWCVKRWGGDREALYRRDMLGSERIGEYVSGPVEFAWCAYQTACAIQTAYIAELEAEFGAAPQVWERLGSTAQPLRRHRQRRRWQRVVARRVGEVGR